jgi:hypothetical protein
MDKRAFSRLKNKAGMIFLIKESRILENYCIFVRNLGSIGDIEKTFENYDEKKKLKCE